jgi:hypothetical protein
MCRQVTELGYILPISPRLPFTSGPFNTQYLLSIIGLARGGNHPEMVTFRSYQCANLAGPKGSPLGQNDNGFEHTGFPGTIITNKEI